MRKVVKISKFNKHCWFFTWSEHQYHMEGMDMPRITPGQGRSEVTGWRNMWKASSRGIPQVVLGTRMEGMAWGYLSRTAWNPPTSLKPSQQHWEEHIIIVLKASRLKSAWLSWSLTEAHEDQCSDHHDESLDRIGVDHCCQTTCNHISQEML